MSVAPKQHILIIALLLTVLAIPSTVNAQINTERVMSIGKNALYFEDYVLSIQYFSQVIRSKPYMAEPYFFRGLAKHSLDDNDGAETDLTECITRNPFYIKAYECRGVVRQRLGKFSEAIEDYNKGLEYNPENKLCLVNRALIATELNDSILAEKYFDELITTFPSLPMGYLSKGHFYNEHNNQTEAINYFSKALELDKYDFRPYFSRALIHLRSEDYQKAADDLDVALRYEPDNTACLINRSIARNNLNDLRGAMADLDKVITITPNSKLARFNRGLLRMQVGDNNRAINDFDRVIALEPNNHHAIYNRALLRAETGNLRGAIGDITKVLDYYPDFYLGYIVRADLHKKNNAAKLAFVDMEKAESIKQKQMQIAFNNKEQDTSSAEKEKNNSVSKEESEKDINLFNRLLLADDNNKTPEYENEFRGRVQNKSTKIDILPAFFISYYEVADGLTINPNYSHEINEFNSKSPLKRKLFVTNKEVNLTEFQISEHFISIDEYSAQLHNSSAIQPNHYFGRAMDFFMVRDFTSAIEDLNVLLQNDSQYALGYLLRAVTRTKEIESREFDGVNDENSESKIQFNESDAPPMGYGKTENHKLDANAPNLNYQLIMRDYDRLIQLMPRFAYAYYNKANLFCMLKDYRSALDLYSQAISLEPQLGAAYFNRALVYIFLGQNQNGITDLSKAGELGIVGAYNIIKRLSSDEQ